MLHDKYYLHNLLCAWLKRVRFMISLLVECRKKATGTDGIDQMRRRKKEREKNIERATQKCGRGNRDINNECMNKEQKKTTAMRTTQAASTI